MSNRSKFHVVVRVFNPGVTGSCIVCTVRFHDGRKARFMVDLGIYQGEGNNELNQTLGFNPEKVNLVFLTHNHSDHVSRLPLFYRRGGTAKIYCTSGTAQALPINLIDSLKIMENQFKIAKKELLKAGGNGKRGYKSLTPITVVKPLYSENDLKCCLEHVVQVNYGEWVENEETPGIRAKFFPNAHLPGAACILVEVESCGEKIFLFFTGDWKKGNIFQGEFDFPEELRHLPVNVITESTYGSRSDERNDPCFCENIEQYAKEEKIIILPTISQFRTQEILLNLKKMQENGLLDPNIPVVLVGPLAVQYNALYENESFTDIPPDMKDFLPLNFSIKTLHEGLDERGKNSIYIAGGGMCANGPSVGFFTKFIENPDALFHFTSYCAEGTIGRKLQELEGENAWLEAYGRMFHRKALVKFTQEFSGHATIGELLKFLSNFKTIRSVIVVHGSSDSRKNMKERVKKELKIRNAVAAERDEAYVLGPFGLIKVKPSF